MAIFLSDTFTDGDVLLATHTPEIGGTWTEHPNYPDDLNIQGATDLIFGAGAADFGIYYNTAAPIGADYSVEVQVFVVNNSVPTYPGSVARVDVAANTMYRWYYDQFDGRLELEKVVAGAVTPLGNFPLAALTNSQTYTGKLEVIGSAIKVYWEGVEAISVTDSSIAAAGKAGVLQYSANGQQVTAVVATDIITASTILTWLPQVRSQAGKISIIPSGSDF